MAATLLDGKAVGQRVLSALAVASAVYQQLVDKTAEATLKQAMKVAGRLGRSTRDEPLPEITPERRDAAAPWK